FDDDRSAKTFFEGVRNNRFVDGMHFRGRHYLNSKRNDGDATPIEDEADLHVVITYPPGMSFEIDSKGKPAGD
ncbi:MAG TPA: hypothetical protein VFS87_08805, partial [Qipengyuania sp.]|nr:hypothetical protein [Qipengyuania sp.]